MAYSSKTYTGDSSVKRFAIPFSFINQDHLVVTVDGETKTLDTDYTIDTDTNEVVFGTAPGAVAVKIERHTPITEANLSVVWSGGSSMSASHLNLETRHLLFLIQELTDALAGASGLDIEVTNGIILPVHLNAAVPGVAGQVPSKDSNGFTWINPPTEVFPEETTWRWDDAQWTLNGTGPSAGNPLYERVAGKNSIINVDLTGSPAYEYHIIPDTLSGFYPVHVIAKATATDIRLVQSSGGEGVYQMNNGFGGLFMRMGGTVRQISGWGT